MHFATSVSVPFAVAFGAYLLLSAGKASTRHGQDESLHPQSRFRDMSQISRGKFVPLRRATAGFTTSALDGYGLRDPWPARPPPYASYPVLVHRLASLLHASFRPRLAASVISPLRFPNPSPPPGWVDDLHLQAVEHARHTKKSRSPKAPAVQLVVCPDKTR